MDFFDIIHELRKGDPDIKKAVRAMKILGWICIAGGLWNYAIFFLAPFDEMPFKLPAGYPYIVLISLSLIGVLFFYSSSAIKEMNPVGKRAGQLGIILLILILFGVMFFIFPFEKFRIRDDLFSILFIIIMTLAFAQFLVPAYFGVRYLGRLPIRTGDITDVELDFQNVSGSDRGEIGFDNSAQEEKYKDALLPFGIFGSFAILIAVPLIGFLLIHGFGDPKQTMFLFFPVFLLIFFAPIAYNFVSSPFQEQRDLISSSTGGGSIFLFNGTWPFFRLLIYKDGLEIRVMFHRFFIPYDKMDDIPEKAGFFSRGILFRSNLPGVPSGIRYQGFGIKKTVKIINQNRKGKRNRDNPL